MSTEDTRTLICIVLIAVAVKICFGTFKVAYVDECETTQVLPDPSAQ